MKFGNGGGMGGTRRQECLKQKEEEVVDGVQMSNRLHLLSVRQCPCGSTRCTCHVILSGQVKDSFEFGDRHCYHRIIDPGEPDGRTCTSITGILITRKPSPCHPVEDRGARRRVLLARAHGNEKNTDPAVGPPYLSLD